MKNFFCLFLIFSLLAGCQSAQDAFTLKKKNNGDEFLIEKKNPLVLPPNFSKLPAPGLENEENLNQENDTIDFENILKSESQNNSNTSKKLSIEDSILENINKNASD